MTECQPQFYFYILEFHSPSSPSENEGHPDLNQFIRKKRIEAPCLVGMVILIAALTSEILAIPELSIIDSTMNIESGIAQSRNRIDFISFHFHFISISLIPTYYYLL